MGLQIRGGGGAEVEELRDEIAPVVTDFSEPDDVSVPTTEAVEERVDEVATPAQPQLVLPDWNGRAFKGNAAAATVEKRLYLFRSTILKAGSLRDLALYVVTRAGGHKVIMAVYDTGEAKAGHYTRLAWKELEPPEAGKMPIVGDPNIPVDLHQQIMIGFVANNSVMTLGREGSGAVTTGSALLPAGFLEAGGGNLPKAAGFVDLGAFEAPAEIAEAALLPTTPIIPFLVAARVS